MAEASVEGFQQFYFQQGDRPYTRWASQVALAAENLAANAGGMRGASSIPGLGRAPGGGNGNPRQDSSLENSMDRGAWQATLYKVAKNQTRLSDLTHTTHTQDV